MKQKPKTNKKKSKSLVKDKRKSLEQEIINELRQKRNKKKVAEQAAMEEIVITNV